MVNDIDDPNDIPILEEPETIEMPEAGVGTLFNDDMPTLASKTLVYETLLRLLTSDIRFSDFIREVVLIIMKAVKSEGGSFLEVDHEAKCFFFRTAVGHSSDRVIRFTVPLGKGIVGYVAESKQPLLISNMGENAQHLKQIADTVGFDVRNMIAFPILVRGSVFGVIELLNRVGEPTYSPTDIDVLKSLADAVARAIEIRLMINWSEKQRKSA